MPQAKNASSSVSIRPELEENRAYLEKELHYPQNFDIRAHLLRLQGGEGILYYIDGFVKEDRYEKIIEALQKASDRDPQKVTIPYAETHTTDCMEEVLRTLLCGGGAYFAQGYDRALLFDTRLIFGREISEPENDRVLRGAREGFVENLLQNTALIRRRLRSTALRFEHFCIGEESRTDVLLCYMEGEAEEELLRRMRHKLRSIRTKALSFGQESLCEALVKPPFFNPFPKVRYTERPDSAAAQLLEGKVLLLCDNTPACMILPVSIFDFMQESDDFYFPPLTSSYLRLLRMGVFFLSVFLTPVWYWLLHYQIPPYLSFLMLTHDFLIPIFVQLLLVEFAVDGLKLASLNTPSMLNNSLSIIGGLLLGDLAVQIGILAPQVIFYMAFVAIGSFAQPNYELGYAFKFMRLSMLALTALFDLWGLIAGFVLTLLLIACNRTVDGRRRYLYPLLPWNGKALLHLFVRPKLPCLDKKEEQAYNKGKKTEEAGQWQSKKK